MKAYIIDDYDYDCEVRAEGDNYFEHTPKDNKLYEIPDELYLEYKEINKRREELKEKLLLIVRQCRIAELQNPVNGVKSKGFD